MSLDISQAVLADFHEKHFSKNSRDHFATHFLGPVEEHAEDTEADELGYYPDGIKRTLTDEQIAIFRHSEIESLLRERRYAQEAQEDRESSQNVKESVIVDVEEGEVEETSAATNVSRENVPTPPAEYVQHKAGKMSKKQRKVQYAKEKGFFKQNIKPDLRKRTWDKVDAGMDSLMYDDDGAGFAPIGVASQRRKISYDDD